MRRKTVKINILMSVLSQLVSMVYGLLIPRLVLSYFGSEVNGLALSIGQYLNFATILEGGVSGVVMARLFTPLSENDTVTISAVVSAARGFYKKISLFILLFTGIIAVLFPIIVSTPFDTAYVFALVLIIGGTLFAQYCFAIHYRLLLLADQKGYIIYAINIVFTIVNTIFSIVVLKMYPEIHVLKIVNCMVFFIQPIFYYFYVKRHYGLLPNAPADNEALKQRWDGFGQNIAYYVHSRTDVIILTLFGTLREVSVYSVYGLAVGALKPVISAISQAIFPSMGNALTSDDNLQKQYFFECYEFVNSNIVTFVFVCCGLLITPFVKVYTRGITDVNYDRLFFGILLVLSEAVYCYREPYVSASYAAGKFKETAKFAYCEALINIIGSLLLVNIWGLSGIVFATLLAMCYRFVAHVVYLRDNILFRPLKLWFKELLYYSSIILATVALSLAVVNYDVSNYYEWFLAATETAAICIAIMFGMAMLLKKQMIKELVISKRKKK